jgi:hypothetical protein
MATLSETQLRDIAASAGTLFERLQAPPDSDGLEPSREAVAAFLSWKKVSCGPDDEAFRRRLSWDGLDEARVLRSLSAPLEFADLPRWTRWIELVLEEATPSAPEIEPLAAEADVEHAAAGVIPPGEEFRPRRRADRADVEAIEQRAGSGQGIDVRRSQVRVAVNAEIAPALIVGEDDDDVGTRRGCRRREACRGQCRSHPDGEKRETEGHHGGGL